jgi:hypothetical protein
MVYRNGSNETDFRVKDKVVEFELGGTSYDSGDIIGDPVLVELESFSGLTGAYVAEIKLKDSAGAKQPMDIYFFTSSPGASSIDEAVFATAWDADNDGEDNLDAVYQVVQVTTADWKQVGSNGAWATPDLGKLLFLPTSFYVALVATAARAETNDYETDSLSVKLFFSN